MFCGSACQVWVFKYNICIWMLLFVEVYKCVHGRLHNPTLHVTFLFLFFPLLSLLPTLQLFPLYQLPSPTLSVYTHATRYPKYICTTLYFYEHTSTALSISLLTPIKPSYLPTFAGTRSRSLHIHITYMSRKVSCNLR